MIIDSSYYEEEFLDSDEQNFHKLSQKPKLAKQAKKQPNDKRAKREEKLRQRTSEQREYLFI